MNKKIIMIMMIFTILMSGVQCCLATDGTNAKNVEINVKGETTIKEGTKTVELILSLGKFTGVEENIPFGYEGKLEYDKNMFESVTVEGVNKWTAEYSSSTNNIIGDTAKATANTDITKIVLTLKEGIKPGATGIIKLNNFLLTDENNDFTFNKEITITMEPKQIPDTEKKEPNKQNDGATNNAQIQGGKITNVKGKTDTTTVNKNIPKTGNSNLVISILIVVIAIGVFSLVHCKKIKLK